MELLQNDKIAKCNKVKLMDCMKRIDLYKNIKGIFGNIVELKLDLVILILCTRIVL